MAQREDREYAELVFGIPQDRSFHYRVPEHLRTAIEIGKRCRASFGRREMTGYCVGFPARPEVSRVKDILDVVDPLPVVTPDMLKLTRWIADYYCCSWGEALEGVLPAAVKRRATSRRIRLVHLTVTGDELKEQVAALSRRAPRQARALEILGELEAEVTTQELMNIAGASHAVIKALRDKRLVEYREKLVELDPFARIVPEKAELPELTEEQKAALALIEGELGKGDFGVVLLNGVTGSGKTEVYLRALSEVVARGKQAIVLVPEISLTPQTIRRFKSRSPAVAILHSHLTDAQRYSQWQTIQKGEAQVVIGARSAVFAPTPDLGLIVVDEEHESTFKQEQAPRYHARDVGIMRAKIDGAVVILGSATPSLESLYNCQAGRYRMARLTHRVEQRPMPKVDIIDMTHEFSEPGRARFISRRLRRLINESLSRNEQVMLFLNRRGFATYVHCARCKFVLRCTQCDIALTYHKRRSKVICHYCGRELDAPQNCPECLMPGIKYFGLGTQKVEEEIAREFPDARVLRMDSDSMRGRDAHRHALADFHAGKTDILVGTQMIAKGLDFPNVTLVGVVLADSSLHLADFRAAERTFQLVAQVAGRTGRGEKGGEVVVQTLTPDHCSIVLAAQHDHDAFAKAELESRRQLFYPPYSRVLRVVFQGKDEAKVRARANEVTQLTRAGLSPSQARVLGPVPCPIALVKNRHRWHLIVKGRGPRVIASLVTKLRRETHRKASVQMVVDVDPTAML